MENWSRKRLKRGGEELLSIASSSPSSLLHDFLPRTDVVGSSPSSSPSSSSSRLWLCFWLARAGCNRFPEARAHYRPVGLAITCEASFDFVCASQHSFRLSSTRPSEILRGPFQRKGKRLKRERERGGKGEQEYPEKRQSVAAVVAAFEIGQTVTIIRYEDAVEAIVISTR